MPFILERLHQNNSNRADFLARWTDSNGNQWLIYISLNAFGDVVGCSRVTITPETTGCLLTQSILRQIPLAEIERSALRAEWPAISRTRQGRGPRSGAPLTDQDLRDVADAYIEARNQRLPVQAYVAAQFGVALSTAAKRIAAARKSGFIHPETPSK